jgi:hypothetical protein
MSMKLALLFNVFKNTFQNVYAYSYLYRIFKKKKLLRGAMKNKNIENVWLTFTLLVIY